MLTLVIPTFNRPEYLKVLFDYYVSVSFPYKIIVVDSSSPDLSDSVSSLVAHYSSFLDCQIFYKPSLKPTEAVASVVEFINTPFSIMTGDDDFLEVSSLRQGIQFLSSNNDFSTYGGLVFSVFVSRSNSRFLFHGIQPVNKIFRLSLSLSPLDRLIDCFNPWNPCTFSLSRTECFKRVFQLTSQLKFEVSPDSFMLDEWSVNGLFLIYGKQYKSEKPFLYMTRHGSNGHFREISLISRLKSPLWHRSCSQLASLFINELLLLGYTNSPDLSTSVFSIFSSYYSSLLPTISLQSWLNLSKERVSKMNNFISFPFLIYLNIIQFIIFSILLFRRILSKLLLSFGSFSFRPISLPSFKYIKRAYNFD